MTLNTLERSPKRSANQWTAPGLDCIESFRRFFEYEIDAANPIEMWFVTAPIKKSAPEGGGGHGCSWSSLPRSMRWWGKCWTVLTLAFAPGLIEPAFSSLWTASDVLQHCATCVRCSRWTAAVKTAIGDAAPGFFLARFKSALDSAAAWQRAASSPCTYMQMRRWQRQRPLPMQEPQLWQWMCQWS